MVPEDQKSITSLSAMRHLTEKQWLFLIIALAIVLRLGSALYQGNQVVALPGVWDQLSYDGLAQRVVAGNGFSFAEGHWPATRAGEPTAHWSYLYTIFLSANYMIFGYQPLAARLVQALIAGILQTWFTWRIGKRLFGEVSGLAAALLSAIYIYFFYYSGSLITEPFYFVGILWCLDVSMRLVEDGQQYPNNEAQQSNRWLWIELGLAISVTVLLRQVFLLFVPFLFLWIWWNIKLPPGQLSGIKRTLHWPAVQGLLAAVLVIVLMIIPWTIRNYLAFDVFVPLNTNAGFAFFWGNHPVHGTHFTPLLGNEEYQNLIPEDLRSLSEAELDRALLKLGIGFIIDQPHRIALLSLSRVQEYIKFWPTAESGTISNFARVASFGLTLPIMLYGLWLSLKLVRKPKFPDQSMQIVLLYLFLIVYAGVHLLSWTLIRYRLPLDAVLLLFAGLAVADFLDRFGVDSLHLRQNPVISGN